MEPIVLNGITWGHSRGLTPLLAAAQRYTELHPHITINWKKRTLQEFADFPIEKLAETYDLLIVDHPWVGCANATKCVLPLDEFLPSAYLQDQLENTVGYSHLSYEFAGKQWALAIDAATPVASYRKDLLELHGVQLPDTWDDLLALAAKGKVLVPGIAIDTLMAFYSFCIAHGKQPFIEQDDNEVIEKPIGLKALQSMKTLWDLCDPVIFGLNPIAVAEKMTQTDDYFYCPFAYGYSNYTRRGYGHSRLHYANTVRFGSFGRLKTTLGGTGISVSANSLHKDIAVDFAQWVVSPAIQEGLYTENGGQPGHRKAWLSEVNNALTQNYFSQTLPVLDNAYVRPRYNGYLHFQDLAGDPVKHFLQFGGDAENVLKEINRIYAESKLHGKK